MNDNEKRWLLALISLAAALFGIIFALLNGADISDIRIRPRIRLGGIVCVQNADMPLHVQETLAETAVWKTI